jgi:tripartite-type tricarboxylate transporter receptor subunit TctC
VTETNVFRLSEPGTFVDALTEVLRRGARDLLAQAVEAEVAALLDSHADKRTEDGRRRVVRHGHLPEREIMTGIGPVTVRCPRVRAATPILARTAAGETYPARTVRLLVGQTAGGAQDIVARLMAHWLSERIGRQFVVENKPGAGTNIATETVVRSPSGGYTLLLVGAPNAINATLYDKLSFNFMRDIAPVASFIRTPEVLVLHPSVSARTVSEFIALAKAEPDKISIASPGIGTGPHMSAELLKAMAGIRMTHVPYHGGGQAMTDLVGGQVQAMFIAPVVATQHIAAGRLHALAVTTPRRSHILPDVPSMSEFLPGYESGGFFGIGAPQGTPVDVIDRLNSKINAALADSTVSAPIADMGATVLGGSPAAFGQLIADETKKWSEIIKSAGIKLS